MIVNRKLPRWKETFFHSYDKPRKGYNILPRPFAIDRAWGATIISGTMNPSGSHPQIVLGMDSFVTRNTRQSGRYSPAAPDTYPANGFVMEIEDAKLVLVALSLAIAEAERSTT